MVFLKFFFRGIIDCKRVRVSVVRHVPPPTHAHAGTQTKTEIIYFSMILFDFIIFLNVFNLAYGTRFRFFRPTRGGGGYVAFKISFPLMFSGFFFLFLFLIILKILYTFIILSRNFKRRRKKKSLKGKKKKMKERKKYERRKNI